MIGELDIPFDDEAERTVIGCAVDSARGYRLAASRLAPDDFWRPAHRELFKACASLEHLDGTDLDTEQKRVSLAARIACIATADVAALIEHRSVMWDRNGGFASRVKAASDDRRLMSLSRRLHNALGSGDRLAAVEALRDLQAREVA